MVIVFPETTTPTYFISPSPAPINEGQALTTTIRTTNVADGTTLYWALSGTGINAADFAAGELSGSGTIRNNSFSFAHTLKNDLSTNEGNETLQILLFSDSDRTKKLAQTDLTINDTSSASAKATYTISPSVTSINEGQQLSTTIRTTGVANGTTLYWGLSGTGINVFDLGFNDDITGQGTVKKNVFSFTHTLANDLSTNEGDEILQIKLFSDAARTQQVGSTATVTVNDTSRASYTISPSATSINEGQKLTTTIRTTGVANGTTLYWGLSGTGINVFDLGFNDDLTGQGTVKKNVFSFTHTLANDLSTNEGDETLQIKLFSDAARTQQVGSTATVTINDTSRAAPSYSITPSPAPINEGQALTTTIRTTNVSDGTTLYWALSGTGINAADFTAGKLSGSGTIRNNSFSFAHTLKNDLSTNEGNETLQILLFSDAARTQQVGSTSTITVNDTSSGPSFKITPSSLELNEGQTLTTTIGAEDLGFSDTFYWQLFYTGDNTLEESDLNLGSFTGSGTVGPQSSFVINHEFKRDLRSDNDKTILFRLFGDSARTQVLAESPVVTIRDTSKGTVSPAYRVKFTNDHEGNRFAYYDSDALFNNRIIYRDGPVYLKIYTPNGENSLSDRSTYVYIHGWEDSTLSGNTRIIANALLQRHGSQSNIVLVDWYSMSKKWSGKDPQPTAEASVTKQLGETVAHELSKAGADPNTLTIIGHSLGSFVAASAASHMTSIRGKIRELVALDSAFGSHGYDVDARNGIMLSGVASGFTGVASIDETKWPTTNIQDFPLHFSKDFAENTSSYTASDYRGGIVSSAGDNYRASTADKAYIVQYTAADGSQSDKDNVPQAYHNGTIAVYADLIRKANEHPYSHWEGGDLVKGDRYNAEGRLADDKFDGVIIAPTPWSISPQYRAGSSNISEKKQAAPISIGWTDSFDGGAIYGTPSNDVMFYDGLDWQDKGLDFSDFGVELVGGAGNDLLGGGMNPVRTVGPSLLPPFSRLRAIDILTGQEGADTFFFGYKRYGKIFAPYTDKATGGFGTTSYGVVSDFSPRQGDKLQFAWGKRQMFYRDSGFDSSLESKWGEGVAFFTNNSDLIAYVPHVTTKQVGGWVKSGVVSFGFAEDLDSALAPPPPHLFV